MDIFLLMWEIFYRIRFQNNGNVFQRLHLNSYVSFSIHISLDFIIFNSNLFSHFSIFLHCPLQSFDTTTSLASVNTSGLEVENKFHGACAAIQGLRVLQQLWNWATCYIVGTCICTTGTCAAAIVHGLGHYSISSRFNFLGSFWVTNTFITFVLFLNNFKLFLKPLNNLTIWLVNL